MPDLLRRVAVRTVVFALALSVIVPLSARSATPVPVETHHLLTGLAAPETTVDRGPVGRAAPAALSLQPITPTIGTEAIQLGPLPTPGVIAPQVTFGSAAARPAVIVVRPPAAGSTVSGLASWYCCTAGWRGVAAVALPGALGGHYDPPPASRYVTICAERCARLPVVDYCDCYWGTPQQKVVDLSPEAWSAISSTNRYVAGVVKVTIYLG